MGIIDTLRINDVEYDIGGSGTGLTDDLKSALDQIAQKVAYIDENGQDYYDALYASLYPPANLSYISCVYTQSGVVYDTDSLNDLKSDLVVTAHYDNGTANTITLYALSGTLATGTSTITVTYGGKTTTFNVTVTHQPVFTQKIVDVGTYIGTGMYATQYNEAGGNPNIKEDVYSISDVKSGDKLVLVVGWNTGTEVPSAYISTASKTVPNHSEATFEAHPYNYGLQEFTITSDYDVLYIGINNGGDKAYLELCTWTRESGF